MDIDGPAPVNLRSKPATPLAWQGGAATQKSRLLPEETPVALTYNRASFAVMMASPGDLRDFAIGFSFTEGIIETLSEIEDLEIIQLDTGLECRMSLNTARAAALEARRRKIAGPVGCGLCGMDSIEQAIRPARTVASSLRISPDLIARSFAAMEQLQTLNKETHAVHAAEGALLLTSRISIELIQKAAMFGAPILAAISVPTARSVREAEAAGITLIGIARRDGFEIFTHPERIAQP